MPLFVKYCIKSDKCVESSQRFPIHQILAPQGQVYFLNSLIILIMVVLSGRNSKDFSLIPKIFSSQLLCEESHIVVIRVLTKHWWCDKCRQGRTHVNREDGLGFVRLLYEVNVKEKSEGYQSITEYVYDNLIIKLINIWKEFSHNYLIQWERFNFIQQPQIPMSIFSTKTFLTIMHGNQ